MRPSLSVVVPLYRTGDAVAELVGRLRVALAGEAGDVEILLVDDASPDDTLVRARAVADATLGVRVIALPANVGQHRAILAGMAKAVGERVAVMDGDLQDPPEAVPALLAKAREGWEVVFAARRGEWQPAGRMRTSRLFKTLLGAMTGIPADCGTFFVVGRAAVDRALAVAYRRPWVVTMVGAGERIATVPVERAARPHGRSAYSGGMRLAAALSALAFTVRWRLGSGDGDPPAGRGRSARFAALALLLSLPALFSAFTLPFFPGDEGYHLEVADAIRLGGVPGKDIELVRYLPGPFLPIAAVHAAIGPSVIGPRILFALLAGVCATLAVSILRRLGVRLAIALAAGALLAIVPGAILKGYIPFAALLLLSGLLAAAGGGGTLRLGVATGVALALRLDTGLLALALAAATLVGRRVAGRRAGLFPWLLGLALPLLPVVLVLAARGGAGSLVAPLLRLGRAAAGLTSPGLALPFPGGLGSPRAILVLAIHGGAAFPLLLLGAGLVVAVVHRRGEARGRFPVPEGLLLAVCAAHVPAWLLERPDAQHLATGAFSFLLPSALLVDRWLRRGEGGDRWFHRFGRPLLAVGLILHAALWVTRELPNGDGGSPPIFRPRGKAVRFEGIRGPVPMVANSPLPPLVTEIRRLTPRGESIVALPFAPGLAFLSRRPLAGPQRFLAPHNAGEAGEATALTALSRASVVALNTAFDYGTGAPGRLPAFAPRVAAAIERDWKIAVGADAWELRIRKPGGR